MLHTYFEVSVVFCQRQRREAKTEEILSPCFRHVGVIHVHCSSNTVSVAVLLLLCVAKNNIHTNDVRQEFHKRV